MTAETAARGGSHWAGAFTRSEAVRGWTLLSPTMVVMSVGLAAPLVIMLLYSFWRQDGFVVDTALTAHNYDYALGRYWPIFMRSLWISGLVTFVTVGLAYPMAYYVAFHVKRGKFIWLILLTIPFWTSYLLRIFAWRIILANEGVINGTLTGAGILDEPIRWLLFSETAIIITMAHAWAAFAILPIYVSLEKVDRTLLEAAADLGDRPARSFWRITFPLSLPGVISAIVLIFVPTIGDYVTPVLVGGPRNGMIASIIYAAFKANDWPLAAATAMLGMLFVAAIAVMIIQLLRHAIVDPIGAAVLGIAIVAAVYLGTLAFGLMAPLALGKIITAAIVLAAAAAFIAGIFYLTRALRISLGQM